MPVNPRIAWPIAAGVVAVCAPVVALFEGYIPHTYMDPVGIPTICYGHTATATPGRSATLAECTQLLHGDLAIAYGGVMRCIGVPLKPQEAAALVSFTYNVGTQRLCTSTMVRMINAGMPGSEWCAQLDRFVFAKGVKLPGLIKRRAAERRMCELGPFANVIAGSATTAPPLAA